MSNITRPEIKNVLALIGFLPKSGLRNTFYKCYQNHDNYEILVDLNSGKVKDCKINWGDKIKAKRRTTSTFYQDESLVVLECTDRLLSKGYPPENIILEQDWQLGHKGKGFLDILVNDSSGDSFLMIECKTWGDEYIKEQRRMIRDGGQLFSYLVQEPNTKYIILYSSQINRNGELEYRNGVIDVEKGTTNAEVKNIKGLHQAWNKQFATTGIFNLEASPYNIAFQRIKKRDLISLNEENSKRLFYDFLEILRHNVVSDKPNAFNKVVNLFLCKIVDEDEKQNDEVLEFQWRAEDTNEEVLMRLNDLYKRGMAEYLNREITDYSSDEIWQFIDAATDDSGKKTLLEIYKRLRLHKSQEFAFVEVYNQQSFEENCIILREVVQLFQDKQFRYSNKQQFLGDFFEQLLKESLKQEAGQFFTPVPIARFVCRSIPFQQIIDKKIEQKDQHFLPFVIDYACGSGHFLTEVMDHINQIVTVISKDYLSRPMRENLATYKIGYKWAKNYVYGIEKDWRLAKTTKLNCFLNGDGDAEIIAADGLANFSNAKEYIGKLKSDDENKQDNQQFDVLIANPPYSVKSFKGTVVDGENSFLLYDRLTDQSSEIECLFIERAKQILVDGGFAGVILPLSILNNSGIYANTRELLLKFFYVKAIVEFGGNTFMATGTNTIAVFLERRSNNDWIKIDKAIKNFFRNYQDVTIAGIVSPISKYVDNVWNGVDLSDYITLISGNPNQVVQDSWLYQDYLTWFNELTEIQKFKKRTNFKNLEKGQQIKQLDELFFKKIIDLEQRKILYFLLSYNQQVVTVKAGNDLKTEREFLGYQFSNRRGFEGMRWLKEDNQNRGITKLYDHDTLENNSKVNTYILRSMRNEEINEIGPELQQHISVLHLQHMVNFEQPETNLAISTSAIQLNTLAMLSKWETKKLGDVAEIYGGSTPDTKNFEYWDGNVSWATLVDTKEKYLQTTNRKITQAGLESCSARLLPINTVLFSSRATIGDISITQIETATNQGYKNFVCNPEQIHYEFLYYILKYETPNILLLASGMTYPEINKSKISDFRIPIPPLDVQEEIVNEILNLDTETTEKIAEILERHLTK